jgi:hypothetical protein
LNLSMSIGKLLEIVLLTTAIPNKVVLLLCKHVSLSLPKISVRTNGAKCLTKT